MHRYGRENLSSVRVELQVAALGPWLDDGASVARRVAQIKANIIAASAREPIGTHRLSLGVCVQIIFLM